MEKKPETKSAVSGKERKKSPKYKPRALVENIGVEPMTFPKAFGTL
jgi:hypothetical protein